MFSFRAFQLLEKRSDTKDGRCEILPEVSHFDLCCYLFFARCKVCSFIGANLPQKHIKGSTASGINHGASITQVDLAKMNFKIRVRRKRGFS